MISKYNDINIIRPPQPKLKDSNIVIKNHTKVGTYLGEVTEFANELNKITVRQPGDDLITRLKSIDEIYQPKCFNLLAANSDQTTRGELVDFLKTRHQKQQFNKLDTLDVKLGFSKLVSAARRAGDKIEVNRILREMNNTLGTSFKMFV